MSPIVRNIIFVTGFAAMILGAARSLAALPHALHGAGIVAPHGWEEVIVQSLQACGQMKRPALGLLVTTLAACA